jgi:formylglycine-generating enzyme required for sulfatase activity
MAAVVALWTLLVGVIIYVQTDYGRIRIEVNDPKVSVQVDGKEITIEERGEPIKLRAGKHSLLVQRDGLEVETREFKIRRGENESLRVTLEPNKSRSDVPKATATVSQTLRRFQNSVGMNMIPIAAGEFDMGSDKSEETSADDERPRHRVKIGRPFFVSTFKTTQKQFEKVLGRQPSWFSPTRGGKKEVPGLDTTQFPVESVTQFDAIEFCNKLSEQEHRPPYYRLSAVQRAGPDEGVGNPLGRIQTAEAEVLGAERGYRLPTEAEWEYCARAGTKTQYSFGNDVNALGEFAWFLTNSAGRPRPVGEKRANPWGLFDMGGLVWEWCEDVWHPNYEGAPLDGSTWRSGGEPNARILRGGSFLFPARCARPANRLKVGPGHYCHDAGFRVVLDAR